MMMAATVPKRAARSDWLLALLLTILALVPRVACLDLAEFKLDEASHYRLAGSLGPGNWSVVGSPTSLGFPKGPLFIYALALPMQVSRDPRVVTGFLGLLAAAAVGGFYCIMRRPLGRPGAFAAALIFALNPQAILYARKLFTADLLPPLCTLFLAAGLALSGRNARRLGSLAALAGCTFSLLLLNTFSPLLLFPALAWAFCQRWRDLRASHYLGAALALGVPLLPYVVAVLPQLVAATRRLGSTPVGPIPLLRWTWDLLYGAPWPTGGPTTALSTAVAVAMLAIAGAAFLVREARRQKGGGWAAFVIVWIGGALLLSLVFPVPMQMHYLVVLYPVLFVLPGAGVRLTWDWSRWAGVATVGLVLTVAGWQTFSWVNILRDVASGVEGYGTPLGYWWPAAQRAQHLAAEHGAEEVLLLVPGDRPWDEKAQVLAALLSETPHRLVDAGIAAVYPTHKAVLLIASEAGETLSLTIPCTEELGEPLRASPSGGLYYYHLWQPGAPETSALMERFEPLPAQWTSGVRLLGYRLEGQAEPGGTLNVELLWETARGAPVEDIHWFNHLIDEGGRQWAQFDYVGWPTARWREGERVVTHFCLSIEGGAAPGPYELLVGQYVYPSMENVPTLDAGGNAADYAVRIAVSVP